MSDKGLVTIMDVARDHAAQMGYCHCSICCCARQAEKLKAEREKSEAGPAQRERVHQNCKSCTCWFPEDDSDVLDR